MIKKFMTCLLTLALLCGAASAAPKDPYNLAPVLRVMDFKGVHTAVQWADCGELNAFYQPGTKTVTMCNELKPLGGQVIRYVLAHELAHGVIGQRDLAYVGSPEWAADELAALMLTMIPGGADDVWAGGMWFMDTGRPENPYDDHLGDTRRGYNLACIAIGSTGDYDLAEECVDVYAHVLKTWITLLTAGD